MATKERRLNDKEIYDLLLRIDDGYYITDYEEKKLSSVTSLDWTGFKIVKLPNSLRWLTSLTTLDLSYTPIKDIRMLSNLKSLTSISLKWTPVKNIQALSKMPSLTNLELTGVSVWDIRPLSNLTSLSNLYLNETKVYECVFHGGTLR